MRILQKLTSLLFLLSLATATQANLLSISEAEINRYLATRLGEKIPLQDKVGIPMLLELDYNLQNLATKIGQTEEKKVELSGLIDTKIGVRGKQYQAQIQLNLDTVPFYDPEKGAVFLKDVRLLSWAVNPTKYENELQTFLPMIADGLAGVLNRQPVYTLDETKMKEAMVKKFGKAIVVEKGELRLETKLF